MPHAPASLPRTPTPPAALHGALLLPSLGALGFEHLWGATWEPNADAPHLADITVDEAIGWRGWRIPGTTVSVTITQTGPSQVFLDMRVPVIGRVFITETVSPVSPLQQRVLHAVYAERRVPRVLAKLILAATVAQYERDVPIWANKVFKGPNAALVHTDRFIKGYRAWNRQFWARPGQDAITFEEAQRAHIAAQLGLPDDAAGPLDW